MTPEEKISTYFYMQSRDAADREIFDQIVDDNIIANDAPVGITVEGKENVWAGMDRPAETKQGPGTFAYNTQFLDYVGDENLGFARWCFKPTGMFGMLWGVNDCVLSEEEAPTVEMAVRVEFSNGKISRIDEYWDPSPMMRAFGIEMPEPGIPG